MTDPAGSTAYFYERRGLLRREERLFSGSSEPSTSTFTYDADGNRSSLGYPSGLKVTDTNDYAGRPVAVSSPGTTFVSSVQYLPFGPMSDIVYGNGTHQTMTYDARYRVTKNKLAAGAMALAEHDYSYDASGNITAISDVLDGGYDRTFGYDDLNRLTTANAGPSLWGSGSFTYDAMGNMLSSRVGDNFNTNDAYFTYVGTTPKIATVRKTALNDPGEFSRRASSQSVGYQAVTYDNAGNELTYVATRAYSPRNLLASVTAPAETLADVHRLEYQYDGRGIRVIRAETQPDLSLAKRYFTYSPELNLLSITHDDRINVWGSRLRTYSIPSTKHDFVWFNGRPLAQLSPDFTDGAHWYFDDHLGTPLLQTNASAAIVWQAEYEPYGEIWTLRVPADSEESPTVAPEQPLRFPGQEAAMKWEGTEERYNIFRWYRSSFGRYTQSDPLGITPSLNLFNYVNGNPIRFSDLKGLMRIDSSCLDCPCKAKMMKAVSDFNRFFTPGWGDRNPSCRAALVTMGAVFNAPDGTPPITCMTIKTRDMVVKCAQGGEGCGGPPSIPAINFNVVWVQPAVCSGLCGNPVNTLFHEALHNCGAPDERYPGGYVAERVADICIGR